MKRLCDKLRMYEKEYEESPFRREIEGTVELLREAADKLTQYEELGTVEDFEKAIQNVKTLSDMWEKLNDKEVAEYYELMRYKNLEEQGKPLKNLQELKDSILNRMKEFMDEYRSYSESSVDHFGGKADAMETAMRIVNAAFLDEMENKET